MVMSCILDIIIVVLYSLEDILYSVLLIITVFSILSPGENFSWFDPLSTHTNTHRISYVYLLCIILLIPIL